MVDIRFRERSEARVPPPGHGAVSSCRVRGSRQISSPRRRGERGLPSSLISLTHPRRRDARRFAWAPGASEDPASPRPDAVRGAGCRGVEAGFPSPISQGASPVILRSRTQTSVTFSRDEGANPWLTCCLAFLFIVPAILYVLLSKPTRRVTVNVYPYEGGSRLIVGGDDHDAVRGIERWASLLRSEYLIGAEQPPPAERNAADRIRELARLRDEGLITEGEYEAKRQELLEGL
jgi:hypothetical protein